MKELILDAIKDLVSDFTYYDRKEDEELSADDLKNCVDNNEITIEEMVETFKNSLTEAFN